MIYDVFAIHDEKAEAFLPPFILPNQNMAKRVFADCVNSDDHQFGKNPEDYTLFRLGQFDDHAGQFLLDRTKHSLGNGVEFRGMDSQSATEGRSNGEASADQSVKPFGNGASVLASSSGENSAE